MHATSAPQRFHIYGVLMKSTFITILTILAPSLLGLITIALVAPNVPQSYEGAFVLLGLTSIGSIVLGMATLIFIAFIAKVSRGKRSLLLTLFKPTLKFTQLSTVLLVACHAFTLTISIYFLEAYYISRVHVVLIFIIGAGSVWAALKVLWFSLTHFKEAEMQVLGKVVKRKDQPKLWDFVGDICQQTKTEIPANIVLGLSPTYFVTEAAVCTHEEKLSGKTLYISLPFSHLLSHIELKSIIAHEMGHFVGQDTQFSKYFYPIYRGAQNTLDLLSGQMTNKNGEGSASGLALIPSLAINSYFFSQFSILEHEIGRKRELEADRIAAESYSNEKFANALIKVHACSAAWPFVEDEMRNALASGEVILNSSTFFKLVVEQLDMVKMKEFLGNYHTEHPTDTHPALHTRLVALNSYLTIDALESLNENPDSDMPTLISNLDNIEKELTAIKNQELIAVAKIMANAKRAYKANLAKEKKEENLFYYNELLRKMMVLLAMCDGKITAQERLHIVEIYKRITGDELDQADLIADISSYEEWNTSLFKDLKNVNNAITNEGKILLIKASLLIANADNDFADVEKRIIREFIARLGVSEPDVKKAFEELLN